MSHSSIWVDLLICEKCGETVKKDEERTHKIFCYSWLDEDKNNKNYSDIDMCNILASSNGQSLLFLGKFSIL